MSPGPPCRVAAEKLSGWLGLRLSDQQLTHAGLLLHYGLGIGWAPLYVLLRRRRIPAPQEGFATGLAGSRDGCHPLGQQRVEEGLELVRLTIPEVFDSALGGDAR